MKTPEQLVAEAKEKVTMIDCDQFKKEEESLGDSRVSANKLTVLDVREEDEYESGHIPGALHIPRGVLEFKVGERIPAKGERIVICCATGGRAALAGAALMDLGYTNVAVLDGGYKGYCAA